MDRCNGLTDTVANLSLMNAKKKKTPGFPEAFSSNVNFTDRYGGLAFM
jgi:hypothetical protein